MDKLFKTAERYVLYITILVFPIAVFSLSSSPFVVPKLAALGLGVGIAFLLFAARIVLSGKLELHSSPLDLPASLIALSYLLSAILKTPNKTEAFLLPGTATIVLVGVLIYFLINQHSEKKGVFSQVLLASGATF